MQKYLLILFLCLLVSFGINAEAKGKYHFYESTDYIDVSIEYTGQFYGIDTQEQIDNLLHWFEQITKVIVIDGRLGLRQLQLTFLHELRHYLGITYGHVCEQIIDVSVQLVQ